MALSWRTESAFPRLCTYAEAVKREAETKPIRGREPEVKPLGRRHQWYYNIAREADQTITVKMGSHVCIRYCPDDTVLVYDHGYWNRGTEHDIVRRVTGISTKTQYNRMWARASSGWHLLRPNPKRYYDSKTQDWKDPAEPIPENRFKYENGLWHYLNPPEETVHTINRKGMNAVWKRYKGFIDYACALYSLRGDVPSEQRMAEYTEHFNAEFPRHANGSPYWRRWAKGVPLQVTKRDFTHEHAAQLVTLMTSSDAADNFKAYLWLDLADVHIGLAIQRVLIQHHYDEVLTAKPAPTSKTYKRRYHWAVPAQAQTA